MIALKNWFNPVFPHLFFVFFPHSALMSLPSLFIPHLCLLQPPLSLPLSTFLGEWVESSMGMWDPRRAVGGFASYQSSVCVQSGVFLSAGQISQQWRLTAWHLLKVQKVNVSQIALSKNSQRLGRDFVRCDRLSVSLLSHFYI